MYRVYAFIERPVALRATATRANGRRGGGVGTYVRGNDETRGEGTCIFVMTTRARKLSGSRWRGGGRGGGFRNQTGGGGGGCCVDRGGAAAWVCRQAGGGRPAAGDTAVQHVRVHVYFICMHIRLRLSVRIYFVTVRLCVLFFAPTSDRRSPISHARPKPVAP